MPLSKVLNEVLTGAHRAEGALPEHPVVPVWPLAHVQLGQIHLAGFSRLPPERSGKWVLAIVGTKYLMLLPCGST